MAAGDTIFTMEHFLVEAKRRIHLEYRCWTEPKTGGTMIDKGGDLDVKWDRFKELITPEEETVLKSVRDKLIAELQEKKEELTGATLQG